VDADDDEDDNDDDGDEVDDGLHEVPGDDVKGWLRMIVEGVETSLIFRQANETK